MPLDVFMNRDPRFALSQEVEAKQTILDQLRALAADDPDFFTDLTEQKPEEFRLQRAGEQLASRQAMWQR